MTQLACSAHAWRKAAVRLAMMLTCSMAPTAMAATLPAIAVGAGQPQRQVLALAKDKLPGAAAFYDAIGIRVPVGTHAQFVVGDNLSGYYEAYTHAYGNNDGGYIIGQKIAFHGYASSVDGQLNARHNSGAEMILPYGHRVFYPNGAAEEMALLSKQQAFAFEVRSPNPAALAILPLIAESLGNAVVVIPNAAGRPCIAFSADQAFELTEVAAQAPLPRRALQLKARLAGTSFTVVAAFGATPEQAARNAERLALSDPLRGEQQARYARLTKSFLWTDDLAYNRALSWAKAASELFVVEQFGTGIWAGLPWFRDNWGRDTFIAMPGTLLVSGQFDTAKAVLQNFARYQNLGDPKDKHYGRIPNRVAAGDSIIYNTVDGTPWMLREALEYIRYTGDLAFAAQMYKLALPYFDGALRHYVDSDGLLTHDDADTWMDARIKGEQPWSARGPRAVEIQALWYTALRTGADFAQLAGDEQKANQWRAAAEKARSSFLRLFWDGTAMADRLRNDGSRDLKLRPNQLMLVSIPFDEFIPAAVQARVTRNAVSGLLYPHGIASLSQDDPYFHPWHVNPALHHKDAAYHQGTIWGWNAGFTISALTKFGQQDHAYALARNLGWQILSLGTLGNMSELLNALPDLKGRLTPSGTYAQSWSVAEFARNGYQDFLGFRPDLLANTLAFVPALPSTWKRFDARLPFGAAAALEVGFKRQGAGQGAEEQWTFRLSDAQAATSARTLEMKFLNPDQSRSRIRFLLKPGVPVVLTIAQGKASLDGRELTGELVQKSYASVIGKLAFVKPKYYKPRDFPMLAQPDTLQQIIERGAYR